jgi:hypothetical protein
MLMFQTHSFASLVDGGPMLPPKILSHRRSLPLAENRGPVPMAKMGRGLPHGTSPWAEGPREDVGGDEALNHLNPSER